MHIIGTRAKVKAFQSSTIYEVQDEINEWVDKEELDIINTTIENTTRNSDERDCYTVLVTYLEKVVR